MSPGAFVFFPLVRRIAYTVVGNLVQMHVPFLRGVEYRGCSSLQQLIVYAALTRFAIPPQTIMLVLLFL